MHSHYAFFPKAEEFVKVHSMCRICWQEDARNKNEKIGIPLFFSYKGDGLPGSFGEVKVKQNRRLDNAGTRLNGFFYVPLPPLLAPRTPTSSTAARPWGCVTCVGSPKLV